MHVHSFLAIAIRMHGFSFYVYVCIYVYIHQCFIKLCDIFRSFLQFTVTSRWPHGVKLGEDKLMVPKSVSSESLQVLTPEVQV